MKSRQQNLQTIRVGLDRLRATLDQKHDKPEYDLGLLTGREGHAFKKLKALASANGTSNFLQLDDMQLIYLRALFRKATNRIDLDSPTSPDDRSDIDILIRINSEFFDVENIDPLG